MVNNLLRGIEKTEQAVSDEFIDGSGMLAQLARKNLEVNGQVMDKNIGWDLFAMGGKSFDIGEENGEPADFASEDRFFFTEEKPAYEIVGHILNKRAQPRFHAIGGITK